MHATTAPISDPALDDLCEPAGHDSRAPETRSRQRPARRSLPRPATRDSGTAALVRSIDRQTAAIERRASRAPLSDLRQRMERRQRDNAAAHALASRVHAEARTRRGVDPLSRRAADRAALDVTNQEMGELRRLRRENRQLRAASRRPGGPVAARSAASALSTRNRIFAMHRSAVMEYLRRGTETFNGVHLRELERRAHTSLVGQDGGYMVHPEHSTGPIEALLLDMSPLRSLATVQSISSASFKEPFNTRGTQASWVGETEARSESDTPQIVELEFHAMELYAKPLASQTLLEDASIDIEGWLAEQVADAFASAESEAFITGDGNKRPMGLLSYDKVANASWEFGKVGFFISGSDTGFDTDPDPTDGGNKLLDMVYGLRSMIRQNASWLMNRGTIAKVRQLKDAEGRFLWDGANIQQGQPPQLLGYEVHEDDFMPDIEAGSFAIGFGDWKKSYRIVDRLGLTVLRDPYTSKPYVMFYTRKRVGGGVKNFEAFKLMKFSAS